MRVRVGARATLTVTSRMMTSAYADEKFGDGVKRMECMMCVESDCSNNFKEDCDRLDGNFGDFQV